jgi:uncharacterized Rmd1/YagE family protein
MRRRTRKLRVIFDLDVCIEWEWSHENVEALLYQEFSRRYAKLNTSDWQISKLKYQSVYTSKERPFHMDAILTEIIVYATFTQQGN